MKNLLLLFCLLVGIGTFAQKKGQVRIDSMLLVLATLKEDSNKVNLIVDLSKQFYYLAKMNEGITYLKEGLAIAEKLNFKKGIANCYSILGNMVGDTGNIAQARVYFEKSLQINRELNAKSSIVINLNNIGRGYQFESDFPHAIKYFFEALKLAEEIKSNEKIALVGTNLSATFIMQQDYSKAEEYAKMTLANAEIAKVPNYAANALQHLGIIYSEKKDTSRAIAYFNKAIKAYREVDALEGEIECMSELASLGSAEEGLKKRLEVQDLLDKQNALIPITIGNTGIIGITYYNLAKTKIGVEKNAYMQNAIRYLKRAVQKAKEANYMDHVALYSMHLSEVERANGNFKEALDLNIEYHAINDSIYSQETKNKLAAFESQKKVDLKDKEIQINKLVISNQRKAQWGLMAAVCLLVVIGGLLYWQSRQRKKTNTTLMVLNNQLDEANKIKAMFFSILSHDLRSPIVNLVHFLQLQKDSPDLLNEEQQTVQQQNIRESAEGLLNNMEEMLLWSKGQMQNFKPQIKMIPVSNLFEHLKQFFSGTENVSIQYDQPTGIMVSSDENYLQTIMHNLTSNSIKALKNSPNASIKWQAKQEGDQILLSITDNGPGVNEEQVKVLNDNSDVANTKTGFGLHIIRDLAKAIKCRISVQSGGDGGTTFILAV